MAEGSPRTKEATLGGRGRRAVCYGVRATDEGGSRIQEKRRELACGSRKQVPVARCIDNHVRVRVCACATGRCVRRRRRARRRGRMHGDGDERSGRRSEGDGISFVLWVESGRHASGWMNVCGGGTNERTEGYIINSQTRTKRLLMMVRSMRNAKETGQAAAQKKNTIKRKRGVVYDRRGYPVTLFLSVHARLRPHWLIHYVPR